MALNLKAITFSLLIELDFLSIDMCDLNILIDLG